MPFLAARKIQVKFELRTKNKPISIHILNQVNFDPPPKGKVILIHILNYQVSYFRPTQKTESIPIPELKSSQFRPPHWNQVYFDHPHNKVNFDVNTNTMSCYFGCYTDGYMFLWYRSSTYHLNTSTTSCYSWRVHTSVNPENVAKILLYEIYFTTWYQFREFNSHRVHILEGTFAA